MAESVLSDVAARLISKLGSSVLKEIGVWWGFKEDLDRLKRTISTVEAVLVHAEEQSMENPQVKQWLGMLNEALYDVDDFLDEFSTDTLRQQVMGGSKMAKKVRLFFSCSNQFAFSLKMGHKVRDLRQRLDEIAVEKNKFHLEDRSSFGRGFVAKGREQTHSSPPQVIIGREQEKKAIVELLLSSDHDENVSVVPIVGFGGLGKTTLAQLVYNDHMVQTHFELKMWVFVSDDFDVQLLVKKVIESATGKTPKIAEMDPLKNLLHQNINGRKYLLVLDDVWNEDLKKWLSLRDLLAGGARGSKIVITTRLRKVAEMSRPMFTHELRGLPDNEAWSLFKQVAFKHGQVLNPSHEAIGREIVEKCCGVPLAIKTIGGMLFFKDLESEWVLFKDKELSKIDVYKNDILPILILSYNHLPSHYKHCFAYCSLYPKDYYIPVEELIHLWKAQGYLRSTNSNECLQDIGYGYFMDLFRLSFFQDVECDDFGNKYCKMHDLMHDLAISVAGDSFCVSHSGTTSIKEKTQHLSFWVQQNSISQDFSSLLKAKKVRTLLPFTECGTSIEKEELDAMFCSLTRLRVLNLSEFSVNALPSSIDKLKHLRYLDFSENKDVKKLPDSITNLQNLQVLKLRWCVKLLHLPNNMKKLVNLTELDNHACFKSTHMPRGIGQLTRLERLSTFVIPKDDSISKHIGGLDELRALNNLRGELEIRNLRYMKNVASEFQAARLNEKKLLHKLTLEWSKHEEDNDSCSTNDVAIDEMGLEALKPHPNLKELWVVYYRGVRPPSWLPLITNLVSVHFENCSSIEWLPPLNHLPCLAKLSIWDLTNLERIDFENRGSSSFFPSLTDLILRDCPNLKGFVGIEPSSLSTECFPCVSTLTIGGCPNLTSLPLFSELKKLILEKGGIKSLIEVLKMKTSASASESSSSPFYTLSQLQHLEICEKYFPEDELLQYVPSLQHLKFYYCPFQSLASDDKDDGMQWQSLKVLHSVQFCRMRNLVSLPKGLQYITTLQSLDILHCPSLASIPRWMNSLVALQDLTIGGCPQLSERCKNNVAEDWPNIFHVPNICIEGKTVQRNGYYLL